MSESITGYTYTEPPISYSGPLNGHTHTELPNQLYRPLHYYGSGVVTVLTLALFARYQEDSSNAITCEIAMQRTRLTSQ